MFDMTLGGSILGFQIGLHWQGWVFGPMKNPVNFRVLQSKTTSRR